VEACPAAERPTSKAAKPAFSTLDPEPDLRREPFLFSPKCKRPK
jgi:hypothetical protein